MNKIKNHLLLVLILTITTPVFAQNKADRIEGFYLTRDDKTNKEKSQVHVFKGTDGKYHGKIAWLAEMLENGKPKVDKNNPSANLRTRPVLGMGLLNNFSYDADKDEWSDGTIYDPLSGKTYKCFIRFSDARTLKVSGYIGKQWMGLNRTVVWTKEVQLRKQ
ncbi:MAG: DUF2147 domain-containing protein [Bacteroidota bacterium]|nr:DUF2147 domain-containing protein [Bacteroidota bacterium]